MKHEIVWHGVIINDADGQAHRLIAALKTYPVGLVENLLYAHPRKGAVQFIWHTNVHNFIKEEPGLNIPDGDWWHIHPNLFLNLLAY